MPGPAASERHFVLPVVGGAAWHERATHAHALTKWRRHALHWQGALDDTTKDWPKDVPFEDFDVEVSFLNASDKSQVRMRVVCCVWLPTRGSAHRSASLSTTVRSASNAGAKAPRRPIMQAPKLAPPPPCWNAM